MCLFIHYYAGRIRRNHVNQYCKIAIFLKATFTTFTLFKSVHTKTHGRYVCAHALVCRGSIFYSYSNSFRCRHIQQTHKHTQIAYMFLMTFMRVKYMMLSYFGLSADDNFGFLCINVYGV